MAAILTTKKAEAVAAAFAPDGKQLATGDTNGVIRIWDVKVGDEMPVETDQPAKTLTGHGKAVTGLAFTKDALISAGADKKAYVWDVAAGNLIVEEAGGRTSDFAGRPPSGDGRETVASNGHLHDAMIALLKS